MNRYSALAADVVAITIFAFLARVAHQTEEMPLNVSGWLSTLWPFLIGVAVAWMIIVLAHWDGAQLAPAGVLAWAITAVTGLAIWGLRNGEFPHWSFIIVATVMSGLLMLGWRIVARFVIRAKSTAIA
ncbi:DUF3054 domain-containing protein [Corynebacterium alimapuense]|uniref:DUF3054 domain-containing protein n=1 Tax=Corynebacterium alimapuense TaxID=1576874 RepID=A0A3M8KA08_9CORY|nr:DUF3054 domain-containing protein [Corynebacterium alimapuense]RNE49986.1 DUF3054 domain-containing protein [Corynebacterium alimapuense]